MGAIAGKIQRRLVLVGLAVMPGISLAHAVMPEDVFPEYDHMLVMTALPAPSDARIYRAAYSIPGPVAPHRPTQVFPSLGETSHRLDASDDLSRTYALLLSSFGMFGLISLRRLRSVF